MIDDHLQKSLNLDEALIPHPAATFLMRVDGDSMVGCGIFSGDLVIVDRSLNRGLWGNGTINNVKLESYTGTAFRPVIEAKNFLKKSLNSTLRKAYRKINFFSNIQFTLK
ncbi:S24 family peptidase [Acaryochloris sp. CCMEE 5410]|uniref:LexA family protein n=1 Tax=Acaryochloris sp. CCMEE 5410 TaxID=310037 RepID=UPI00030CCD13